jgi:hypothetical protein
MGLMFNRRGIFMDANLVQAMEKNVIDAVAFFPRAFTIVLALALGEAFKQFVTDKEEKAIQWDRLPALLTFLFMAFPFFHGMNRYFFQAYQHPLPTTASYAGSLLFDSIMFLTEAAFFFVMSRSLAGVQWRRFFLALMALLVVDTLWGWIELSRLPEINYWIILNITLMFLIGIPMAYFWKKDLVAWPSIWAAAATFVTSTISYYLSWNFYFPPLPK